jgi:rSAM/selenodomain-associated transferase 2
VEKTISVIIPVLNESAVIDRTLRQFSGIPPECAPHEIIVVDGDSSGSTLKTITTRDIITAVAPKGRAVQMNQGAELASGEVLLFLHADTLLPPGALPEIAAALSTPSAEWGAFDLGIASNRASYRLIEAAVRIRTAITRIPYGDQAIFLTRDLFHRTGGYPPIPIMEDVALMRRVKKTGAVGCRIPEKVSTSPRRWETEGIIRGTLRNWFLITCFFLGARPETLVKYYQPK